MTFADNFKRIRIDKGMSQTQIAVKLKVTPQAVSSWELGRTEPSHATVKVIAYVLGCDIHDLIDNNIVGESIKKHRLLAGLTQDELASKVGVAKSTVSSWEVSRTEPEFRMIGQIANALGCDYNDLVCNRLDAGLADDEKYVLNEYRSLSQLGKMKLCTAIERIKNDI